MTATPSLSCPPPILRAHQKESIHANKPQTKQGKDLTDSDHLPPFLNWRFGGQNA